MFVQPAISKCVPTSTNTPVRQQLKQRQTGSAVKKLASELQTKVSIWRVISDLIYLNLMNNRNLFHRIDMW